ncbi:hypothetical protein B9479_001775 [Cryptococcus floricola]|uniref:AMP-dependent synthetase/ligase domain-containing protein n=1 Tax=Cryptococcus floricola TaxID=2591691 RepID=A0A5D3B363_9TREE|nr:hypothetical protein B9479_001775 [Cryptococcus floricola]
MPDFEIDNLTVLLLALLAGLAIYHRFLSSPNPLVHPLLLGKQSEVSSIRKSGETGVYRAWATGQGTPLTVRPANTVKTVQDLVNFPPEDPKDLVKRPEQRCILDIKAGSFGRLLTDEAFAEIVRLVPLGIELLFPRASAASVSSIITLIPPSPVTSLPLLLLSLSAVPVRPLVILPSPRLLTSALTATSHPAAGVVVVFADLLGEVLEQVWEDTGDKVGILVIGDAGKLRASLVEEARSKGLNVHWWEEVWEVAETEKADALKLPDSHFNDVHSYYYSETDDPEAPAVLKVTHLNATAGIASLLSIFPADKRPSNKLHDVVASAVRLDTPLGMTIALASIWNGAEFRLIGNQEPVWDPEEVDHAEELTALVDSEKDLPKPTVLFITPKHHRALVNKLAYSYQAHPYTSLAARHKAHGLRSGHVDRDSIWDKIIWSGMRENVLGGVAGHKLRAVILVGDAPPASALGASHLLLSLPFTRLHPSIYSTGPVFASHFYDLQSPGVNHILKDVDLWESPASGDKSHSGPPSSNLEVLLKGEGIDKAHDENGKWLEGRIYLRGPTVLERVDGGAKIEEGWVDIGEHAKAQSNGTFIVDGPAK